MDIVSKGGNFLLNIGPKGDGTIPEESVRTMVALGKWMGLNSESIYGTQASPFETPVWGRYTSKAGKLYAHVYDWPENGELRISLTDVNILKAYLLADVAQAKLSVKKTLDGFLLHLPKAAPDENVSVVVIEYKE